MDQGVKAIDDLNWGYRAARVLHVASGLRIFTMLAEGKMSVGQICEKAGTVPEVTERLLIGCVALGLLSKDGQMYENTALSRKYLVKGEPLYQGDIIAHSAGVWDFWHTLADQLKGTAPTREAMSFDHGSFIRGMHNIAVVGRAQMFLDSVDLSGRRQLFDVAGGPGTYSVEACRQYPELRAIVFDLPETVEIAREMIAAQGMSERVSVRAGDWDDDDFGERNDAVLLSNILHGAGSNARMKLTKAFDSLVSGGLLIVQEFLLNDGKTGPLIPALFNIMVGAYSCEELLSEIEGCGFAGAELKSSSDEIGCSWVTALKQ